MSSGATTKAQRLMFKFLPFLYKKCPEGNYHKKTDRLCFCQYFDCPSNGIYDFKNGKRYVELSEYERMLNQWHEEWEKNRALIMMKNMPQK